MGAMMLQAGCTMKCPHGGTVQAIPSQSKVLLNGAPVLLVSDLAMVAGCAFTVGPKPQPCLTVQWSAPATRVTINGTAPLLQTSIGLCKSAEGIPQGMVLIVSTQPKASAQ
jgi:hypothetical protein